MNEKQLIKKYNLGDITVLYLQCGGQVEMTMVPAEMEDAVRPMCTTRTDSLIQMKIEGDAASEGFAAGHSERNCMSTQALSLKEQSSETRGDETVITTVMEDPRGLLAKHVLTYKKGAKGVSVYTVAENAGEEELTLEMLSSFSISCLSPFAEDEGIGRLFYHRIRSRWSSEGRVESGHIEDLQLDASWARHGISVEKFGQIGSMPVRKFFPFIGIEDREAGCVWATQLDAAASWQIEMYRKDEKFCISGGLPDYDFGHFKKILKPGEAFTTPVAYSTVVKGDFEDACANLVSMQDVAKPFRDGASLPAVFNEYCTTWGNPSEQLIEKLCDVLKGKGFEYFVIDAGWYTDPEFGWENSMGDWVACKDLFPRGLAYTTDVIRKAGMKPGIWFELEVVGKNAHILSEMDHMLKKNGKLIRSGDRFFWDMRDPWTQDYLEEKVIGLLNQYGFRYIKIDYNESIGIGCDGSDSLGMGLYENILATREFFRKIHEKVPGIVIELCSSGGHRLVPGFLDATDMASFSDAHEEPEIPVIAANVHRVMRSEKSQIWSVIQKNDSLKRIGYSVTNTFLGVLCISGDVLDLSKEQWDLIDEGIAFYRKLDRIQKDGRSYFYGTRQLSYRKLQGWQGVLRKTLDETEAYLVLHSFEPGQKVEIEVGEGYEIKAVYEHAEHPYRYEGGTLSVQLAEDYEGMAFYLVKKQMRG